MGFKLDVMSSFNVLVEIFGKFVLLWVRKERCRLNKLRVDVFVGFFFVNLLFNGIFILSVNKELSIWDFFLNLCINE